MGCKRKLGILGGTFDPVHYGHLIMAELVRDRFELDSVLFIPSGNPPHKNNINVTPAEIRYGMVSRATESNPYFKALRIEIDREGYTYTIDTLKQLKEIYTDASLFFIIGADVVFDLMTWKNFEEVFKNCEFIAVLRPGFEKDKFLSRIKYLNDKYYAVIHPIEVPLVEISSTYIRERASEGKSIKYLVPECVEEYIMQREIYNRNI